jgi:organic radical activating enzyme
MNTARNIAFGYSTRCNIKCDHCVAAGEPLPVDKMAFPRAEAIIEEMARCRVQGVSFTAGEPFLFLKDILRLVRKCKKNGMYSRMVTNGFWAGTERQADQMAEELVLAGLSQLRISFSRWHQKSINRKNVLQAAEACRKNGLDYFISFVTDFSSQDDEYEQYLRDNQLSYFPEPLIYFGRAGRLVPSRIFTDFQPNTCALNPYLSPGLDLFACCDAGSSFKKTNFFFLGNLDQHPLETLFQKYETNKLYGLIRCAGLSRIASSLGFRASEIVRYRKCELCEKIFNSVDNVSLLESSGISVKF